MARVFLSWDRHFNKARTSVLIHSLPCVSHCIFCSYISDNLTSYEEAHEKNLEVLKEIPRDRGGLVQFAPSASIFEVPLDTLVEIKRLLKETQFDEVWSECHWFYRNLIENFNRFMPIPSSVKIGIETFDNAIRRKLGKHFDISSYKEVLKYTDSISLIVGVRGQTIESVSEDIVIGGENFRYVTVNTYDVSYGSPNSVADTKLLEWFKENGEELCAKYPSLRYRSNASEFLGGKP